MNTNSAHNNEIEKARHLSAQTRDDRDAQACFGRRLKVSIKGAKEIAHPAKASVVLMCG